MQAIRVHESGGPEKLVLEQVADPVAGEDEALVKIEATGVNFIEIYQRTGLYPMKMPYTPGSEGAGTVVSVGRGVTTVKAGDRVVSQNFQGSYAELAIAKADRLVRVPQGVSTKDAAAVFLQGLTAHYLTTSVFELKKDQWCLVHAAAGGVGLLLCQMARKIGAHVIGTVSTEEKATLAREAGADEIIFYTKQDVPAEVARITGGRKVDVVYDSVGRSTLPGSLDSLKRRGVLALFGQSSGAVEQFDPLLLSRKGSLYLTRPTLGDFVVTREELEWRADELLGAVADHSLHVRIDRALPLAEAAEAHRAIASRQTTGKVLLVA